MKASIVSTLAIIFFVLGNLAMQVQAQEYGVTVNGLLLEPGGGALNGQTIGRNTEATAVNYGPAQPVTVFHPVRRHAFPGKICRDFIVVERRHGFSRDVVVKTVCRDRYHFRGGDYRHHFRDDYRPHFRGDHRYQYRDNHRKHFRGDSRHHWKGRNRHHRW